MFFNFGCKILNFFVFFPDKVDGTVPILPRGLHQFPFKFQLPESQLPCSFESKPGFIRYYIKVTVDIPYASPPQGMKYFTIIGPHIDCMDEQYLVSEQTKFAYQIWFWILQFSAAFYPFSLSFPFYFLSYSIAFSSLPFPPLPSACPSSLSCVFLPIHSRLWINLLWHLYSLIFCLISLPFLLAKYLSNIYLFFGLYFIEKFLLRFCPTFDISRLGTETLEIFRLELSLDPPFERFRSKSNFSFSFSRFPFSLPLFLVFWRRFKESIIKLKDRIRKGNCFQETIFFFLKNFPFVSGQIARRATNICTNIWIVNVVCLTEKNKDLEF